jgi:hypothetical protein
MNAHQLDANGVIINTIVVGSFDVFPNLIDASQGGSIGDTWNGETIVKKPRDVEKEAASVRASRTEKLRECDWTQISDSTADKAAWATYRQALRDVTKQAGFPWSVE